MIDDIKMGDPQDFRNFMSAVIDKRAFDKISEYIEHARSKATIVAGGKVDGATGYFVGPTLVETKDPAYKLLCEEIFGPVVTAYVYDDAKWAETLALVDATSPYALTGAVFAQDRARDCRSDRGAASLGRQLLRQRQADRCRRRSAAVWWRAPDQERTTRPVPN